MAVKATYDARDPATAAWLLMNNLPYLGTNLNYNGKVNWTFENPDDAAWTLALQWRYEADEDQAALSGHLPTFARLYKQMAQAATDARRQANNYSNGTGGYAHDRRSA